MQRFLLDFQGQHSPYRLCISRAPRICSSSHTRVSCLRLEILPDLEADVHTRSRTKVEVKVIQSSLCGVDRCISYVLEAVAFEAAPRGFHSVVTFQETNARLFPPLSRSPVAAIGAIQSMGC